MASHSNGTAMNDPTDVQFGGGNEPSYESKLNRTLCVFVCVYLLQITPFINCMNQIFILTCI